GDLGVGAARILHIAPDHRDLVRLHLVGVELEVELHPAVDQLSEFGADARVRQGDADLHFLRVRRGEAEGERDGGDRNDALDHESLPPEGSNPLCLVQHRMANTRARVGNRASRASTGLYKDGECAMIGPRRLGIADPARRRILCDKAHATRAVKVRKTRRTSVAKFKVVTASGPSFSVPGAGYKREMEALTTMDRMVRDGRWAEGRPLLSQFPRLMGQTLGLIAFGHVARAVAVRARAFGFHILAYDPYVEELVVSQYGVEPVNLTELLQRS